MTKRLVTIEMMGAMAFSAVAKIGDTKADFEKKYTPFKKDGPAPSGAYLNSLRFTNQDGDHVNAWFRFGKLTAQAVDFGTYDDDKITAFVNDALGHTDLEQGWLYFNGITDMTAYVDKDLKNAVLIIFGDGYATVFVGTFQDAKRFVSDVLDEIKKRNENEINKQSE